MNNRLLTDEQLLKLRASGDIHAAINAQLLYTDVEWCNWGEEKCPHVSLQFKRECLTCWVIRKVELDNK